MDVVLRFDVDTDADVEGCEYKCVLSSSYRASRSGACGVGDCEGGMVDVGDRVAGVETLSLLLHRDEDLARKKEGSRILGFGCLAA